MNLINEEQPAMKKTRIHAEVLAQAGALTSAVISSACCWLPLLLLAFGVSGGALSATFEAWRPVLLPVTFMLLGIAFFLTYRKPKKAAQGMDVQTQQQAMLAVSAELRMLITARVVRRKETLQVSHFLKGLTRSCFGW